MQAEVIDSPNGLEEIPQPEAVNARWLLDTAIEKADHESPDGLFQVYVPVFGRFVVMRRVSFAEMSRARALDDPNEANKLMMHLSIVDPPFSLREIDEVLTNSKLVPAAIILNNAVNKINHLTEAQQQVLDAKFRTG